MLLTAKPAPIRIGRLTHMRPMCAQDADATSSGIILVASNEVRFCSSPSLWNT